MGDSLRVVENAVSYIGDICVHSDDFDDHPMDVRQTVTALKRDNIQMRRHKSTFAVDGR